MTIIIPLTEAQRERVARESAEACACHAASDIELGRRLIKLAQSVRKAFPENLPAEPAEHARCGSMLVWEVAPEIARRLGAPDFERGRRPYSLRDADPDDLRGIAAGSIFGSRVFLVLSDGKTADPFAWSMLRREPCNGNPVVIGLDRVAPPTNDRRDMLAMRLLEVSRARGHDPVMSWSPDLNAPPLVPAEREPRGPFL